MLTSRNRGFTIIEVLVVIAVIGILLAVGLPSYAIWAQNLRIRGATESVQNGLQLARTTAIARNTQAILVFQADPNDPALPILSYFVYTVPDAGNPPADWQNPDAGPAGAVDMIRRHDRTEDASGTAATFAGGAYMVTFGPLGALAANPDGSLTLTQVDIASATSTDPAIRALRIAINPGGSSRSCDPAVSDPADTRKC